MSQTEDRLMCEISSCKRCSHCGTPFHFNLHGQKVMVISAMPSLQAEYKPLPSIRFFRHLCIALFGDKYLREKHVCDAYIREFCDKDGNIYWTHYKKCYSAELAGNLANIDDTCASVYLKREVQALNPEIIIVLGNEIRDKVARVLRGCSAEIIYKPFPQRGDEVIFDEVRSALSSKLKYVKKIGFAYNGALLDYSQELEGHAVHLQFEREAFAQLWHPDDTPTEGHTFDALWRKNIVVPNTRRSYILMMTYAYCESQIKTLLYDYFSVTENYTVLSKMKEYAAAEAPTRDPVRKYVNNDWLSALEDYVSYERPDNIRETASLCRKLSSLRRLRNAIAHNGCRLQTSNDKYSSMSDIPECVIPGVLRLAGFVWITADGETSIAHLVDETTELLCKIQ